MENLEHPTKIKMRSIDVLTCEVADDKSGIIIWIEDFSGAVEPIHMRLHDVERLAIRLLGVLVHFGDDALCRRLNQIFGIQTTDE